MSTQSTTGANGTGANLAQLAPAATTLTDAFTAGNPTADSVQGGIGGCQIDTIVVVNSAAGADNPVRITHAIAGAADSPKQNLFYGTVPGNGRFQFTGPLYLAPGDKIRVYSTTGTTTAFNIYGIEIP